MAGRPFDFVLFDLGGVLVRLGGVTSMQELSGLESQEELWTRWLSCPWVRSFERGLCSAQEFAIGLVDDWGLPVTPENFLEVFRAWPEAMFDGARELVTDTRGHAGVGLLSNSNGLHWDLFSTWGLGSLFDSTFLSHEMGRLKPDREVFEYVVDRIGSPPAKIVFLDDNELNVTGARAVGLTALRVQGPDEARAALIHLGVLER
jgi:glucose-1-phosphatase